MENYVLDGDKYYYNNGKWLDKCFITPPASVISKLNKLLNDSENFSTKTVEELEEIAKVARNHENYQLAQKALEKALEKASMDDLAKLLPMITSNYRKLGMTDIAIECGEKHIELYNDKVCSSALFTSIGAAYADKEDYSTAQKFADRAYATAPGRATPELSNLYGRIKAALDN